MFQSPEEKQAFTQQQQFQQQLPHDKVVEIKKEVPQDRSLKQQFYTGNSKFVFADKNAKLKGERKELTCDQCTFRCLTKALMASHSLTIHGLEGQSLASSYSRLESLNNKFFNVVISRRKHLSFNNRLIDFSNNLKFFLHFQLNNERIRKTSIFEKCTF